MASGFEYVELNYESCLLGVSENVHTKEVMHVDVCVCVCEDRDGGRKKGTKTEIVRHGKGAWGKWSSQRQRLVSGRHSEKWKRFSVCSVTSGK